MAKLQISTELLMQLLGIPSDVEVAEHLIELEISHHSIPEGVEKVDAIFSKHRDQVAFVEFRPA